MRSGRFHVLIGLLGARLVGGCAAVGGTGSFDDLGNGDDEDTGVADRPRDDAAPMRDGGGRTDGGAFDSGETTRDAAPGGDTAPPGDDSSKPDACYRETYLPKVPIDDLVTAHASGKWLSTSLEVTKRRYPTGHFILDTEKSDPQLAGFAEPGRFDSLMESLMTMCHEETHGYDYEHAKPSRHTYLLRDDLIIDVPKLSTFPRSEVLTYIVDDSTSLYDGTYLEGSMGTYDFADMNDELNAYVNGLACITAVAERIDGGISARDGAIAHILYLQLYLKRARLAHASTYASIKADANWQKFVRFSWARVHFWDAEAKAFPNLQIGVDRIWAHVNEAANLDEIRQFTGDDPAVVACHP
jgi:hypothetical protein